jgi:hypothetical protein
MFDMSFIFGLTVIAGSQLGVLVNWRGVGCHLRRVFVIAGSHVDLPAVQLGALFSDLFIEF